MTADPERSITRLIGLARTGDADAAERLWRAYFDRLVAVARQRLPAATRRLADEEDVALSAFASFWDGVAGRTGSRNSPTAPRLWPLLVAITANKCTDLVRHETRRKRGGGASPEAGALEHLVGREPPPEFACQVADQLAHLLDRLDRTGDPTLRPRRRAADGGRTQAEIADELGYVRETVSRKLQLIELCWVAEGGDETAPQPPTTVRTAARVNRLCDEFEAEYRAGRCRARSVRRAPARRQRRCCSNTCCPSRSRTAAGAGSARSCDE